MANHPGWWNRVIARLRRKGTEPSILQPWDLLSSWLGGYTSQSGAIVNTQTVLGVAAAWSCVRNISEDIGKVPLLLYRRLPGGGKERATDESLFSLLKDAPNEWQTSMEFREMAMAVLLLRGDFYAYKATSGVDNELLELIPLDYDGMQVERLSNGVPVYKYTPPGVSEAKTFKPEQIFHLRGLSLNGVTGLSVLRYHAESVFGSAITMQEHSNFIFANRAKPGGVLEHPAALSDTAYNHLKASFKEAISGKNLGDIAVLEEGTKYNVISMTPEDIQMVEQRKYSRTEIAGIFRMPPHKIGDLERATFSNIEHQNLDYVTDTLLPWARRWEQAITRQLLPRDSSDDLFAEFLFDALLRGDIQTRYNAYAVARQWGWMSADDIRDRENMNPLPDGAGTVYLAPMNMVPADQLGQAVVGNDVG